MKDLLFRTETQITAASVLDATPDDIDSFMREAQILQEHLTEDERRALYLYCDEYGSQVIAWYLNGTIQNHHREPKEEVMKRVALLDSIIAKHPVKKEPRTLYRGLKKYEPGLSSLKIGEKITFKSYSSTSSSLQTAKDFVDREAPILLKINTRQGAPIYANFLEHEYLLPRDSTFTVTGIEENVLVKSGLKEHPGYTVVHLDEV